MTAQTQVYLYKQRTIVVLLEAAASGKIRYNKVYAKDLILNQGVDNLIEFAFLNQEQKPINISNKPITARIISHDGSKLLLQKQLVEIYPLTGIAGLRVSAAELRDIPAQLCHYSLEIPVDEFDYPVFVDDSAGARGVIRIVDSVLPKHFSSALLSIPSHAMPTSGSAVTWTSSTYNSKDNGLVTFQIQCTNFSGTVKLVGTTVANFSYSYDLTQEYQFTDSTENLVLNIAGFHPFMRVVVTNTGTLPQTSSGKLSGDVTKISVR